MDKIIRFALGNRLFIIVLGLIVIAAGYASYKMLKVDAFPDVTPNLVQVFTLTEGLAPEDVEQYVTFPVEVSMNGIPGLKQIRSISNFGLSVVNVYFEDGMDIYFARQLVNERLQMARESIPEGFGEPEMGPISTGLGQILFYYLDDPQGKYDQFELRAIQDWIIKFNLQTVPGVTEVLSIGGEVKQFQVNIRPEALLRYKLSLSEVMEAIQTNNANVGAQFIVKNSEEFVVRSEGLARDLEDLESIVITVEDGTPVYLRDIADVGIGGEIRRGLTTVNGKGEAVVGMVLKLIGTNTSAVIEGVKTRLEEINKMLPEGVNVVAYYDQETLVEKAVHTVKKSLLEGVILVSLVILTFLGGWRPSIVAVLSIPFSVGFTFIAMYMLDISANLMSLGGLAIAIGLLVDGTIVVVENVDRMMSHSDPRESRIHLVARAAGEVVKPIVFAIMIIIVVFLPLFTLQGVEGKTFRPLAYTLALGMAGSIIYTLFLAPVLSALFMKRSNKEHKDPKVVALIMPPYRRGVSYFVRNRVHAVILAVVMLMSGVVAFPFLGSEFVPRLNEGDMLIRGVMYPSISLEEARDTMLRFERKMLKEFPEIDRIVSRVGRGEIGAHADPVNNAEIFVALKPEKEWKTAKTNDELVAKMSEAVEDFPGVKFNFTQPIAAAVDELVTGTKAELAIKLFGPDMEILKDRAAAIERIIKKVPGSADVQKDQVSGSPQLRLTVNRAAIARYGINVEDVQNVIRTAVGGEPAGQIFEGIKRFDIYVRFAAPARDDAESIGNILIPAASGTLVPLSELARIEEVVGSRQITRENGQRFITIQSNVRGRDIGSFVEEGQKAILEEANLPPGYFTTWGGQFELQQQANQRLKIVVPITLFLVFMMLFANFKSLKNAILILMNIPLALVGGILALLISGQNLSVPASVGFIALFGIALANGMVLVTYLNQLVRDGVPIDKASVEGACLRLRPVLMTALAAALGLIPLLIASGTGSEVQKPLATVVMGGLMTSTALTLLVVPALFKWFVDKKIMVQREDEGETHEGDQSIHKAA